MKNYVVYSRGLLRYEGSADDNCDYVMDGGRPIFYSKMNENDRVTVFVYGENSAWNERRDYVCEETPGGFPLRAKKRTVTKF